jgi:hypothetical protein
MNVERKRMRSITRNLVVALLAAGALVLPGSAAADYGINSFDIAIDANASGDPFSQASGHPYAIRTHINWNSHLDEEGYPRPDADLKDAIATLPPGVLGNPTIGPKCKAVELAPSKVLNERSFCPVASQVGTIHIDFNFTDFLKGPSGGLGDLGTYPLFNMESPTGRAARFGFKVLGTPLYLDAELDEGGYAVSIGQRNVPEILRVIGADITFWGIPADPSHDFQRCNYAAFGFDLEEGCGPIPPDSSESSQGNVGNGAGAFPSDAPKVPFLTLPSACTPKGTGQKWTIRSNSWQNPGLFSEASIFSHLPPYAPSPPGPQQGPDGCQIVPFNPKLAAQPTTQAAGSPTGLAVRLTVPTDGLENPDGIAQSHLKKAVVTLPEGVTINPSQAEGLGVCSAAQYAQERLGKSQGEGCPPESKIGSVIVHTPALEETLDGSVYVAQADDPTTSAIGAENPFDSLLAIYVVVKNAERGIYVKLPGKVEPDPKTGQIVTTFDDLPQVPFSSFDFKFREGPRAPLTTPNSCGTYAVKALLYPWARPNSPVEQTSNFQINRGVDGGACPPQGVPPFHPGFSAGALNNNAGSFSPFVMRLTRNDGEQDMTKFSALLPPGVSAKIAGVSQCPDDSIAVAMEKTGTEERESPSCPASSEIGHILAGAGVGSVLTYVPGKMYLGGPYNGSPLSAVVITPAVAGPFDVGTVITREALTLDPKTAVVKVDGDKSDPIPHILKGIPLSVRDIRVYVDKPNFTINPTSCNPSQVAATLFGSFLDILSPADDVPVGLSSRFQAANCAALGFKPKLSLNLTGATKRGQFPGLKAELRPRPGDANLSEAVVTLPRSAFLEQGHIGTICTRVQFAQKSCPEKSIYGYVKAFTPLLDEPLQGPVFLRSSSHKLPDLVLALHGIVDIEAAGRIDSINGRIRSSFEEIPDAPISKVILTMQGKKKGLIVNSRDLCLGKAPKADVQLTGQNAKPFDFKPAVKSACGASASKRHAKKKHPQHY